jgi:hypothetical protein
VKIVAGRMCDIYTGRWRTTSPTRWFAGSRTLSRAEALPDTTTGL